MNSSLLLAVDIGNTNITLGAFDGDKLVTHWRVATRRHMTADEFAVTLHGLFELAGIHAPDESLLGAAVSSVVPTLDRSLREWGRRYLEGRILVVDRNTDTGLKVCYTPPEAVGADRLVNAVAARAAGEGPCIIVDFGTATTLDVVTSDGSYIGGAIFPGVGIASEALFHAASKLPRADLEAPGKAIGQTTATSLSSGMVYGYAAFVDGMVRRFRKELGAEVRAIATGGLAELICAETETVDTVDPWLTLTGLRLIWERRSPV